MFKFSSLMSEKTLNKFGFKNGFSFSELVTNTTSGKTSASGFVGVILCIAGIICFVFEVGGHFFGVQEVSTILDKITIVIGLGAALLGVRKVSSSKGDNSPVELNKKEEE